MINLVIAIRKIDVSKLFTAIALLLICISLFLSFNNYLKGDIFYNEDIARDFLILQDVVSNKNLTLIGPRILAAGGLFHGPTWAYLNLPAYLLGQGNPIALGYFWLMLYILFLGSIYIVARKLFDSTVGILSVLLLTSTNFPFTFNNTFGAILLFPFYFYCINQYLITLRPKFLLFGFLICGFIIQFEIAFGLPVLFLTILYLLYFQFKKKKLHHLLSLLILIIPLSSYFLFDIRNDFIQTHSFINYITSPPDLKHTAGFQELLLDRYNAILDNLNWISHGYWILSAIFLTLILYISFFTKKTKKLKYPKLYVFFFVLYVGFWVISFLYKGKMWDWYYSQFFSVIIIIFCSSFRLINKKVFLIIFFIFYLIGINQKILNYKNNLAGFGPYSWTTYKNIAIGIYSDAPNEFGYFINEHDELGYRTRYAMLHVGKEFDKKGYENIKKTTTYLIMENNLDNIWWKKNKVKILKDPNFAKTAPQSLYFIEKYNLSEGDIKIPADPNLINSLFFR